MLLALIQVAITANDRAKVSGFGFRVSQHRRGVRQKRVFFNTPWWLNGH